MWFTQIERVADTLVAVVAGVFAVVALLLQKIDYRLFERR